jgi:hypothetical protein
MQQKIFQVYFIEKQDKKLGENPNFYIDNTKKYDNI